MQNPDSWGGKKLLRKGAAHVGAWVSQFLRLRMAVAGDSLNRQGLLACTAQGGLLWLCPFWDENMYKRLSNLHVSERVEQCLPNRLGNRLMG